ncbi:MAG: two-component system sensor histidine kinase RppB, partial [Microcoleaceae cyanobacterium]
MTSQKLFRQTQLRLAVCYTLVMGGILTLLGLGVYRAIAHAHVHALDRELLSVAGTLHDSLELKLNNPGQLEPVVRQ